MIQVLFWIIMFVYYVSSDWEYTENKQVLFEKFFIKVLMQIALCYTVIYLLIPRLLNQNRKIAFGLSFFLATYVVHITYTASRAFYLEPKYPDFFRRNDFWEKLFDFKLYFVNITWFILPTIILLAWKYYQDQKEVLILREEKRITELNALKNQLNPHFLFNTLNSIASLMDIDVKRAKEMVADLGDLLRQVLENSDKEMHLVPLSTELDILKKYVSIEKTRFSEDLEVEWDIGPNLDWAQIPSLLLQPLVENAIQHGFSRNHTQLKIGIQLARSNGHMQISITDNGKGLSPEEEGQVFHAGMGLSNTFARLKSLYGDQFVFSVENLYPGVRNFIEIPCTTDVLVSN